MKLTDEALSEMLRLLPIGLKTLFPTLTASTTSPTPILTLLPPSPSTSLPLLLLQLSVPPSTPLVILPSPVLLSSALSSTAHPQPAVVVVHASLVDDVLEQIWEDRGDKAGVLVVGDPQKEQYRVVENAKTRGMKVAWWEEIWEVAEKAPTEKGVLPGTLISLGAHRVLLIKHRCPYLRCA